MIAKNRHWVGMFVALAVLVLGQPAFGLEVYFFRHGETTWNRAKVLQGTYDFPMLTAKGRMMARDTAAGIQQVGITFDRAYTSPLRRARDTAEIICTPMGLKPIRDSRLHEMDVGDIRGLRYDRKTCTNAQLRTFYEEPSKFVARGLGAETTEMVAARLRDFIENELRPLDGKCNRVLCVVHAKVLDALAKSYGQSVNRKNEKSINPQPALQRNCCARAPSAGNTRSRGSRRRCA